VLNLLISIGLALAAFGLGALSGKWTYGLAPALFVFPVAFFLLARRTSKQVEAILGAAMAALQQRKIDEAKQLLESARPLARWQFLVNEQLNAQLGAIEYLQRNTSAARPLLEGSWSRNWQAMGMLAVILHREGNTAEGLAKLAKAEYFASKEPLYWGLRAWLHLEIGQRDQALAVTVEGLGGTDGSEALKQLRGAIANDKLKGMRWDQVFGQAWFSFFPDMVPQAANQQVKPQPIFPKDVPSAMRRGGMTWPSPRR